VRCWVADLIAVLLFEMIRNDSGRTTVQGSSYLELSATWIGGKTLHLYDLLVEFGAVICCNLGLEGQVRTGHECGDIKFGLI